MGSICWQSSGGNSRFSSSKTLALSTNSNPADLATQASSAKTHVVVARIIMDENSL